MWAGRIKTAIITWTCSPSSMGSGSTVCWKLGCGTDEKKARSGDRQCLIPLKMTKSTSYFGECERSDDHTLETL
ncbi:unnamed protein product [Enterobius vermicularis]|uniref:Secreted protein n=1 Tax=Enterobius vermicularis TaxID=51028 RepID=A0A0N4UWA9_ENTVE|nr:unnamed protein product [Enterobius vermicularis]